MGGVDREGGREQCIVPHLKIRPPHNPLEYPLIPLLVLPPLSVSAYL